MHNICILLIFSLSFQTVTEGIINGIPSTVNQFPYMAGIFVKFYNVLNCGGAIVSSRLVITTAHCICNKWNYTKIFVAVGLHTIPRGIRYDVIDSICHEDFDPLKLRNDVGLLLTSRPIKFTKSVKFISLLSTKISSPNWVVGSGWGCVERETEKKKIFPRDLRYQFFEILPEKLCRSFYYSFGKQYFCTNTNENTGMCSGDSGSPVMYKGFLAGIIFASKDDYPDLFINISSYYEWIKEIINIYSRNDDEERYPEDFLPENNYSDSFNDLELDFQEVNN